MAFTLSRVSARICLLFLVLLVTGCSKITIESPNKEMRSAEKPGVFKVAFRNGAPKSIRLQLNTVDVTDRFTVTATGAEASGEDLAEHIYSGKNIFRATAGLEAKQSVFYYDTEGPVVHILSVDRSTNTLTGYLQDISGGLTLNLDGSEVPVNENGQFTASFTDRPINEFIAKDSFGHESVTSYARGDQEFVPGISARLNNGGFNFLTDVLMNGLGNIDFEQAMKDVNPIFSIFNLVKFNLRNVHFSQPVIDLKVNDDERVSTHASIPQFSFGLEMQLFNMPGIGGSVEIADILFDTEAILDIKKADLDIGLANTKVKLQGFHLNLDLMPPIIENILSTVIGGITNALLPFFTGLIENAVLPAISKFVGEIPIEMDLVTIEGEGLHIKSLPYFLDTFDNGLTIDLGSAIYAHERHSNSNDFTETNKQLGSHYVDGETPSLGQQTPTGKDFDFGTAISSNVINQAIFAVHQAGLLTIAIRPDKVPGTTPEGVSVFKTAKDDIQTRDLIGLQLLPASPPHIKLMPSENAHGMLGWHDVTIQFDLKRVGWEDYKKAFSMTFNLEVPFEMSATDDGFLQIGIEQLPVIDVIKSQNLGVIQLTPAFMNGVLDYFMPVIMPIVANKLKAIALPRIAGHSIHPDELWVGGSKNNNFSLAGSLIKLSTTAAAPRPRSAIAFSGVSKPAPSVSAPVAVQHGNSLLITTKATVAVQNAEANIEISGTNPSEGILEYRYRVDGAAWSIWKPRSNIHLRRLLGGHHVVEVCARTVLMKQELNCPVVEFDTALIQQAH